MSERRQLRFDSLGDAVADAEALLARGYARRGKWSLGQCCGHLADWVTYPMDGFPRAPLPVRAVLFVMRNTAAALCLLRKVWTSISTPSSLSTHVRLGRKGVIPTAPFNKSAASA